MKKYVATLLIALMCVASSGNSFTYLLFKVNQSYIIENLCRNRDNKEMQCNGKCHLAEIMAENEEPDQQDSPMPPSTEERITVYFTVLVYGLTHNASNLQLSHWLAMNETIRTNRHHAEIFHPPRS